jgi:radical SAM protein with 4Fe4S-binding SPASM domain
MSTPGPVAEPNANFTNLSGASPHERPDSDYRDYRRRWMENPRDFIVAAFPIHLDVEATNRCNLKCTFCDKLPHLKPEDIGLLDFALFTRIIDEGAEKKLCGLKLSYRGEPLLHPRLADMVAYAKKKGILDVYFNTNAMLLSKAKANALMAAGLDRISVSVEGTDRHAFEKERVGARFDVVKRNLQQLLNLREQNGRKHPKIRLQTVRLPGIDLDAYARYWSAFSDETAAIDFKETRPRDTSLVDREWACPQLWQRMTIEWNGSIMACNNDDYRRLSPGNVNTLSVSECWQAPLVQKARELHMQGLSHTLAACNGCPWRTTQLNKKRLSGKDTAT